jgi:hypothetical protein
MRGKDASARYGRDGIDLVENAEFIQPTNRSQMEQRRPVTATG